MRLSKNIDGPFMTGAEKTDKSGWLAGWLLFYSGLQLEYSISIAINIRRCWQVLRGGWQ